jgi:hypothetical protein
LPQGSFEREVERLGFEFHRGMLWSRELLHSRLTNRLDAVAVPSLAMEQRRRRLNESLNDGGFRIVGNRAPNPLELLMGVPVRACVEELHRTAGVLETIDGLWNEPAMRSLRGLEHAMER